jgi:hypothetical protein
MFLRIFKKTGAKEEKEITLTGKAMLKIIKS